MTGISSLLDKLRSKGWKLATAESCTGGMVAAAITEVAGSSSVFERGFVTYSNQSKIDLLGVNAETLDEFGAVSEEACREMLRGALANSAADIAIATTGIAGPSGGSEDKPIGLIYVGIASTGKTQIFKCGFDGNRTDIREQAVQKAFEMLSRSF